MYNLKKKMLKRTMLSLFDLFSIIIVTCFIDECESSIVLNSTGGYSGILVALSSELREEECGTIVTAIKNSFNEASKALEIATSATFESIVVIVPQTWTGCGTHDIDARDGLHSWNNADFRVGPTHPQFGDGIWTKQPGGCGKSGDFVYVPRNWLYRTEIRKGTLLVGEWAKYRWGVFEESGHYLDEIYPESTRDVNGEWVPNYCTNSPLMGNYESECFDKSDCKFDINYSGNDDVHSSIMAVPEVSGVYEFCDELKHRSDIPTKQNVLCNGQSAQEIISQHDDSAILTSKIRSGVPSNAVSISVVRESTYPSVAIVFETTEAMKKEANQFSFEKESISQFIMYEAPSKAKIGLVSFSDYATVLNNMIQLDASSRTLLAENILKTTTNKGSANLKTAIEVAVKTLGKGNGVILLLTKCTNEDPSFTAKELATAANGHSVWTILYPFVSDRFLNLFTELASLTGGQLKLVEQELSVDTNKNSFMSPKVRMKLSQSLRQVLHLDPSLDLQQVSFNVCPAEKVCIMDLEIKGQIEPSSEVYLYFSSTDIVLSVTILNGGTCVMEDFHKFDDSVLTTRTLKCHLNDGEEKLGLRVERQLVYGELIAELVGHPKFNKTSYDFKIYSSNSIFDLQYTNKDAPVILAELTYLKRSVLFANISIEIPVGASSQIIAMRDDGTGADVTGNDGVYSAYLVPILPMGGFSFNVTANDNNRISRLAPWTPEPGQDITCCGSSIPLPNQLDSAPVFNLSRQSISARITVSKSELNLPPGQIKDLRISSIKRKKTIDLTLTFTATGADLDFGTASKYILTRYDENTSPKDSTLNVVPSESGTQESIEMFGERCDTKYKYSITAIDDRLQRGPPSNVYAVYVPCKAPKGKLQTGAVVGIVFGVLILVGILVAVFCLMRKRKKAKSKGERARFVKNSQIPLSSTDASDGPPPPRVDQIRSVHDLSLQARIEAFNQRDKAAFHQRDDGDFHQRDNEDFHQRDKEAEENYKLQIKEAGDRYLTESPNGYFEEPNIPVSTVCYQKRSYSKDSLNKTAKYHGDHDSNSSLHSSTYGSAFSNAASHPLRSQDPINQVGIPPTTSPYSRRANKSLENLLRTGPPVPPKRVRYYEV